MFHAQHWDAHLGTTSGPPEGNTPHKTALDSYTVSSDRSWKLTEGKVQYVAANYSFSPRISQVKDTICLSDNLRALTDACNMASPLRRCTGWTPADRKQAEQPLGGPEISP